MKGRSAARRGLGGGVIFLICGCPPSKTVITGPACTQEHDCTRAPHYQVHTLLSSGTPSVGDGVKGRVLNTAGVSGGHHHAANANGGQGGDTKSLI